MNEMAIFKNDQKQINGFRRKEVECCTNDSAHR